MSDENENKVIDLIKEACDRGEHAPMLYASKEFGDYPRPNICRRCGKTIEEPMDFQI